MMRGKRGNAIARYSTFSCFNVNPTRLESFCYRRSVIARSASPAVNR
jgi:hypothetical protein